MISRVRRVMIVSEDCKTTGVSSEIAAVVAKEAIGCIDAPIKRVTGVATPIPFSPTLEQYAIPNEKSIVKPVKEVV